MSRLMTKPTKWPVWSARLRSAWASAQSDQSLLSAWKKLGSLASHWAHSEVSDQTGHMPRLIWVFVGAKVISLVLSWGGSNILKRRIYQGVYRKKRQWWIKHYRHFSDVSINLEKNNFILQSEFFCLQVSRAMRKCVLCHMRPTKAQISLHIHAVWSAPLLLAA